MSDADEHIWVVFNGEIFNFKELRDELEQRGHEFRTRSRRCLGLQDRFDRAGAGEGEGEGPRRDARNPSAPFKTPRPCRH